MFITRVPACAALFLLGAALALLGMARPAAAAPQVPTRAGAQFLEVRQADGSYLPLYIKGMNLSVALPGNHPSEFPHDEQTYRAWLKQIAEMNCNVIRLYTILPPEMYSALAYHNAKHPAQPLWLLQGVWVEPPADFDYINQTFMDEVQMNIRNAVDLVHGNANFPDRPGWTGGRYRANVSRWLLGYLLGREWEPDNIAAFMKLHPEYTNYQGKYVSCSNGQPIESWFARILDYTANYEDTKYKVQHPLSFSSWPPTDPLSHVSESNLEDEQDVATLTAGARVDVFSNDAVNFSIKHLTAMPDFKGGLFATYHVYPYWPDFLDNEPSYAQVNDRYGPSNYMGYLKELKAYYQGMPLLIAEYGLPNSPLPAHQQKQGWNHGGLSEAQVAEDMPRMTLDIHDSGCAGGVVFSWMNEWFKKVWMWAEFYNPYPDRRLWYNMYDPEKNYGMLAYLPGANGPNCTLSGNDAQWASADVRPGQSAAVTDGAPQISEVQVSHDEGFLFVRVKLSGFSDWQFKDNGLYLGLDVLGDELGNLSWPGPLNLKSDRGLEEVLSFTNGEARLWQTQTFRFWQPYMTDITEHAQIAEVLPHVLEAEDNRWLWYEPEVETNRRRVGRDGAVYPARFASLNPLPQGSLVAGPGYNDNAVWNTNAAEGVLELRIPWILLGFVGPHQMRVLQADAEGKSASVVSAGVGMSLVLNTSAGETLCAWPGYADGTVLTSASGRYTWPEWGSADIKYHTRLKPVYYAMQDMFGRMGTGEY